MTSRQSNQQERSLSELSVLCPVHGRSVPLQVWLPEADQPRPLVLVGHGGSGHKSSSFVLDIMRPLVFEHGFVVAAIDGPTHGDRRTQPGDPAVVRDEFRLLWEKGGSVEDMVADWRAVLDRLCAGGRVDSSAIGYYGLSMGTAYGLPLLAAEPRIRAAVIGMWGTSRVNSERLVDDALHVRCPTLFSLQWNDQHFTREGQFNLFEALASDEKHMSIYPGAHVDPEGARLEDLVQFLVRRLGR